MKILKFGGSSLATPERVRAVTEIIDAERQRGSVAVVVSAFGGVTDALLTAAERACRADLAYRSLLGELEDRHRAALRELAPEEEASPLGGRLERALTDLRDLLHGVSLVREATPRTLDSIASYGERLSSMLVAAALRRTGADAEDCDARDLILTEAEFGGARVLLDETYLRIQKHFASGDDGGEGTGPVRVVTGFIGATEEGQTTTLGRGGSDYTASLLGAALGVEAVELWTDVDGVMTADPRLVPGAQPIDALSYEELMELSHFGAKVVYPPSVHPTRSRSIPLIIRNTFRPEVPGTLIVEEAQNDPDLPVRGIASIRRIALVRLEGDGMVGVPGFAMRLFGALARKGVNVILISQASSEHSICFAISPEAVPTTLRAMEEEFLLEQRAGLLDPFVLEENLSVVAAVGAAMRERPGIAGRIFQILGEEEISVRAIAQGSSELNISLVVKAEQEGRAVAAIHDAFFAPRREAVAVYLAGVGRVGGALLGQLAKQEPAASRRRPRIELAAVAGSRSLIPAQAEGDSPLRPEDARELLASAPPGDGLDELIRRIGRSRGARRVFVDCTASAEVARRYEEVLESGAAVVTANKLRFAGPMAEYLPLRDARRLYFETTVGAGLPVLRTLSDQLATGDRLLRLEGIFSGTLSYLTDRLAAGVAFSQAVQEAHDKGYTEPDPREDLEGKDVVRKLLILARLAGRDLEPGQVRVAPLLPDEPWRRLSLDEFWQRLPELDAGFAELQARAAEGGGRLAYLAVLDEDGARVTLETVGPEHPCATVRGTDNLISLSTERYRDTPLVVRGPGAGPDVTAAGVFADILRAAAENG